MGHWRDREVKGQRVCPLFLPGSSQWLVSGVCSSSPRLPQVLATTLLLLSSGLRYCASPPCCCSPISHCTPSPTPTSTCALITNFFTTGLFKGQPLLLRAPPLTQKSPPLEPLLLQGLHKQVGDRQAEAEGSQEEGVSHNTFVT